MIKSLFSPNNIRNFTSNSNKLFQIESLNHIGIAVPDLKSASECYQSVLGAKVSPIIDLEPHGVSLSFVELSNTKIELLHPLGESSPIEKYLQKNPNGGIHHICFNVEDINVAIQQLKDNNKRILGSPKIGAHNKPVVFLHPKDFNNVLIELEEN